jgi:sugar phosphate permease
VSGVFNTSQQVGGSLGVAVLTTLVASHGYHVAWEAATGMAAASIIVAAVALRPQVRAYSRVAGWRRLRGITEVPAGDTSGTAQPSRGSGG